MAPPVAAGIDDPAPVEGVAGLAATIEDDGVKPPATDDDGEAAGACEIDDPTLPDPEPAGATPVDGGAEVTGGVIV